MPLVILDYEAPSGTTTVGTHNAYDPIHPFYYYYNYSIGFYMFTAANLGGFAQTITKVAFNYTNNAASETANNLTLYMMHSTDTQFATTMTVGRTNLQNSNRTLVWSGSLTVPSGQNGFIEFPLSTPFNFNGVDRLVIEARNNDGTYELGSTMPTASTALHGTGNRYMWWKFQDASFPADTLTGSTSTTARLVVKFSYSNS